jgi:hypothetical protein
LIEDLFGYDFLCIEVTDRLSGWEIELHFDWSAGVSPAFLFLLSFVTRFSKADSWLLTHDSVLDLKLSKETRRQQRVGERARQLADFIVDGWEFAGTGRENETFD